MNRSRDAIARFGDAKPRCNDTFHVEAAVMRRAAISAEVLGAVSSTTKQFVDLMDRGKIPASHHPTIFRSMPSGTSGFAVIREMARDARSLPHGVLDRTLDFSPCELRPKPEKLREKRFTELQHAPATGPSYSILSTHDRLVAESDDLELQSPVKDFAANKVLKRRSRGAPRIAMALSERQRALAAPRTVTPAPTQTAYASYQMDVTTRRRAEAELTRACGVVHLPVARVFI